MLKVVQENTESNVDATVHGGSLLDEIVRDGARQMLAAALQARAASALKGPRTPEELAARALPGVIAAL